ncbi:MAG: serine hydroxymethyltransferase [Pseudomonadota bacterium]
MAQTLFGYDGFYTQELADWDADLYQFLCEELERQQNGIELIASENIVSKPVMQAMGSILTNKYAEGYPARRYYGGCEVVDKIERLAIERVCKLFDAKYANVQAHSGSQANQAVFSALMKPGDCFMGLSLDAGGHLTHGSPANLSGKWFNAVTYGVRKQDHLIDFDEVEALAKQHQPKLIIAGATAYSRIIDFKRFRAIADEVGAYLMVDMAHFAGLVAAGVYPSPIKIADVVTSTTHKTLRCSRGGLILTNDEKIAKKINAAVFPRLQGGPLLAAIAGKAVGFGEALRDEYKTYIKQVVTNAMILSESMLKHGFDVVTGGTDTHLLLVDLSPKGAKGNLCEQALDRAGITCNKNNVPFDPLDPTVTSGIRLGTPAATSRGFGEDEFKQIADWIAHIIDGLVDKGLEGNSKLEKEAREEVRLLCRRFPIYQTPF